MSLTFLSILVAAVSVLFTVVNADNVVSISTIDELSDTIQTRKMVSVLYYATWHTPSMRFLTDYEQIATSFRDENIVFARVECADNEKIVDEEGIEDYPTLKLYIDSEAVEYEYDDDIMTEEGVSEYIGRMMETSLINVDDLPEGFFKYAETNLSPEQPIAMLLSDPNEFSPYFDDIRFNFDFACKKFYSIPCGVSFNSSVFEMLGVSVLPAVVMLREFPDDEPLVEIAPSSLTSSVVGILTWMQLNAFPKFNEFNEENEASIYSLKRLGFSTHIIAILNRYGAKSFQTSGGRDITDSTDDEGTADASALTMNRALFGLTKALANTHHGKAVFSFVDVSNPTNYVEDFTDRLDIDMEDDVPTIVIANAVDTHVNFYTLRSNVEGRGLVSTVDADEYIQKYFNGELEPTSRRKHDLPEELYDEDGESDASRARRLVELDYQNEEEDIHEDEPEDWMDFEVEEDVWEGISDKERRKSVSTESLEDLMKF